MQLDDMKEVKLLLQDMENLFMNLDDCKKEIERQICIKEAEQSDYLHELELGNLNGIEIMKVSKAIIKTRKERRVLKDKLDLLRTLKGYTDEYIKKGIVAQTKQAIKNIDTLQNNQETREYTPKAVEDLKCAKKKKEKRDIKGLAWAEQPQTINEVGSTFTIQGFDLNYAGVILGPSVKYRDGKIIFDPTASKNEKAVRNRTLSDGTKQKFGETLIQHEVRVLMTRGVNGMYIYACDPELRAALLEAAK